jgi:hypothetical protein
MRLLFYLGVRLGLLCLRRIKPGIFENKMHGRTFGNEKEEV